jgi:opacity protein-like surface antigen
MIVKLLIGMVLSLVSISCAAQVAPATTHPRFSSSLGAGLNYWSGDWQRADINRWGPSAWATVTIWHDLSVIAESHTMIWGGNQLASNFKYFTGGGGLVYTSDYWGRFQPLMKAEASFASLSHPPNNSGRLHHTSNIWTFGGGVEYHTYGQWWTRVEYSYDFFPNFQGRTGIHTLNPRGFTFGETYRFGPSGGTF